MTRAPGRGGTLGRFFNRRRLAMLLSVTTLLAATLTTAPTAAAASPVIDPDANSTAATGWYWLTNATPDQVGSIVAKGYRIVSIEATSSAPTFSVAYVANKGVFERGFWWYFGLTATQLGNTLNANNARPTDIEPYNTPAGLRFAVAMISNTGSAAKGYWWFYNQTAAQVSAFVSANNARLVDFDRYSTASGDRFDFIAIPNAGVDATGWWWYYNLSPLQINNALVTNHARLIKWERTSAGGFDVIMVNTPTAKWSYAWGQTPSALGNFASQKGARIFDIVPYTINGTRYFAAILISNANAETARIRDLVSSKMGTGNWGFYVKQVGGPTIVGLQPDRVFEPASMMKIVHAVTALRQVQANVGTTLSTPITWYVNPSEPARYPSSPTYGSGDGTPNDPADKDVCAYDSAGNALNSVPYVDPLSTIVSQMLGWSDNRATDAMTNRYGFAGLNATATLAGMTNSHVYHRIGCPGKASPQPWHHNDLTLRDAGKIYEGVNNGTLLDSTRRTSLYGWLVGGTISSGSALGQMITAEGQAAGLTSSEISSFLGSTKARSKGGSYDTCPDSGPCNSPIVLDRAAGGTIWIPFKNPDNTVTQRAYVFGQYFNLQANCTFAQMPAKTCTAFNNAAAGQGTIGVEMFRAIVKQAVATW